MKYKEYSGELIASGLKVGIAISRFNDFLTKQLLAGALDSFIRHGVAESDITVVWVPGAYELPLAVKKLAEDKKINGIVALGAVIQGATPHADLINSQLVKALSQISLDFDQPVIDGVVAAQNLEQAIERCGTKGGNRGWKAAESCIEMANLMKLMKK